ERVPAARPALEELALAADEALDARRNRLEQRLDALALRVAGAAEELAEATEAHLHRLAAHLARAVGQLGLDGADGAVLVAGEVRRVAALGIAAAGEELAAAPPLDHHGLATAIAHEVGRPLLALHVAHLDLGPLEVLRERRPEAAHGRDPVLLTLLDEVELVFHAGGELDVQDVGEGLDQQIGHEHAELGRLQAPLVVLDHVFLVEDRAHDAGLGGGPADALLLERLYGRRLQ